MAKLNCFKAYDIRGELGEELNEDIAYRIGRLRGIPEARTDCGGGDVRLTSESLKLALAGADGRGDGCAGYRPERDGRDLFCHVPSGR